MNVQCPNCKKWIPIVFKQLRWHDKNKSFQFNPWYVCQECSASIEESEMFTGLWRVIVQEFIGSRGDTLKMKSFVTEIIGDKWQEILEKCDGDDSGGGDV